MKSIAKNTVEAHEKNGSKLAFFGMQISYGGMWIDLNDGERYRVAGDAIGTRTKTFRQTKASSPLIEGDVLLHAVADMVSENVKIMVYGYDQVDLEENVAFLVELFEQMSYSIRVNKNEYRETWSCQMTQSLVIESSQAYAHAMMTMVTVAVPRYPSVTRERTSP